MTPYAFECPYHGEFTALFPFGTAPREMPCPTERARDGVVCDIRSPRVISAHFGFRWGRDQFHGATIRERAERQQALCTADGVQMEPVGTRWV